MFCEIFMKAYSFINLEIYTLGSNQLFVFSATIPDNMQLTELKDIEK